MASERRRERKVVTVLFCDLVGFTARSEAMDPEDVEAILRPYHLRVRQELERHGGTVEKFIGDAVMALFGAPRAHEDDAERAVRAALSIRDFALAQGMELRIGVTTGEALVSLDSSPAEGEGMAAGDVVNTAARLQSAAPINGILVDETTYRATRAAIVYQAAEPVQAKGKAEPIPVWEVTAARSRFGMDVTHHARVALVGREREHALLRDAFERARHERIPQLVTLVAVPGMGKSRLIYELGRTVDSQPELVTWRQGRCLAYGDGVAFWALAEVVKAQAGILERDTREEVATKLAAAVRAAIGEEGDARWVESHLRPLVGLETETGLGGDRRGEAFAAWRRFLESLAEQRPLVLVIEDLHWADEGLLDFVNELVEWLSGVPLLVVCSARPELLERRPGWGGGKLNASTIGLSPLSSDQTSLLISALLERELLPADVEHTLLERSEGNPLYAEQYALLYLEQGSTGDLRLPETLQGIVAARLDGLAPTEKAVLQEAAVVGKIFWAGALHIDERDTAARLHSLERKGFLIRQRRSSVEGESEWSFAHMLLRDVAYAQIPRSERALKHRRAAEWIVSLGRSDDHAELLAFHLRSALELARAAGQDVSDLTTPARLALRAAGDRAYAVNAYPAAAAYYGEALALWPDDDVERPQLVYGRAHALYLADDPRALEALEQARDALLRVGNRGMAAEAEISLSRIWWHRGQRDKVRAHETRAEQLAGKDVSPATARVLATVARTSTIAGNVDDGQRFATEALKMAEQLGIDELRAHALTTIGLAKSNRGDQLGATRDIEQALAIAVAANSSEAGAIANNLAVVTVNSLDFARGAERFDEARALAERLGDASGSRWLRAQQAGFAEFIGRWDDALRMLDEFIAECEAGSPHYLEGQVRVQRARIREARNDVEAALADYRRAVAVAREAGDPQQLLPTLGALVSSLETQGLVAEARTLADEFMEIATAYPAEAGPFLVFPFFVTHLATEVEPQLRAILGAVPAVPWRDFAIACIERDFARAADMMAAGGNRSWEAQIRVRAFEQLIEEGRRSEGEVQLHKALAFYRSVGATLFINRAEALLAKTA